MANEPKSPTSNVEGHELSSEIELRKAELALKAEELRHRIEGERRSIWFTSPLIVTVCSAVFAAFGAGVGYVIQSYWNYQLEQKKFESALIQKALEHNDKTERAKNLQFLVDAGLIKSLESGRIAELAKSPELLPVRVVAVEDCPPCPPCGK